MCKNGHCQGICEKRGIEPPAGCRDAVLTTLTLSVGGAEAASSTRLPIEIPSRNASTESFQTFEDALAVAPEQALKPCA